MFAAYAESIDRDDPLSGLVLGERPDPDVPDGWAVVTVKAAALNHHDVWSLKGQGLAEDKLPMILGCDAAGIDEDGNEVVVHAVLSDPAWTGDETLDPKRSLLSERFQGCFAERVAVPRRNVVREAGVVVVRGGGLPADGLAHGVSDALHPERSASPATAVLIQGAGGGVATALITLAQGRRLPGLRDQSRRGQARAQRSSWVRTRSSSRAPGCRRGSTR